MRSVVSKKLAKGLKMTRTNDIGTFCSTTFVMNLFVWKLSYQQDIANRVVTFRSERCTLQSFFPISNVSSTFKKKELN